MENILTRDHMYFDKFCEILEGKEGCDFKEDGTWNCKGSGNKDKSKKILKKYFPEINLQKTLKYFEKNNGYCDCEILFNVGQ